MIVHPVALWAEPHTLKGVAIARMDQCGVMEFTPNVGSAGTRVRAVHLVDPSTVGVVAGGRIELHDKLTRLDDRLSP